MFSNLNINEEEIKEITEKVDARQSISSIVKEIIDAYKKDGTIGNYKPKDEEDARKHALAIAFHSKHKNK
jgi:hypothetical protein